MGDPGDTAEISVEDDPSFRLIADSAPVPMWVTNLDRKRSFINRAYVEFLGASYDDAVDFDWRTIIHPEDASTVLARSKSGEASLKPFALIGRYRRCDGQWRWLHSISHPRRDSENRHIGFIGVAHDVTDAKQAELELRDRENQLSALISQATVGFAQVDTDGRFTLVNDRFCEIAGRSREDLMAITMQSITHPEDLPANLVLFDRAVREGTPYTHEKRYIRGDGSIAWVNNSVAVIRRDADTPYGVLAVSLDVTERRRSESQSRKTAESMRLAIEGAGMATWEIDLQTMEGPWSPNRFEILGYPYEATGRGPFSAWLARIHPADRMRAEDAAQACFTKGIAFDIDYRILRADTGEERWLRSHGNRIEGAGDEGPRFVGVSFDITEKKQAEARQQLLIDELNHRVKNMLSIVQSLAQQSFREGVSLKDTSRKFEGRISSLAAAHNLLTRGLWQPTMLRQIIAVGIAPAGAPERFFLSGPDTLISPKIAVTLSLAIHELATNAIKYGALSNEDGRVSIAWAMDQKTKAFRLEWKEVGGPVVQVPERRGFGTRMIEQALAYELGGTVSIRFEPSGLECRVTANIEELVHD